MHVCPECGESLPEAGFCPADGTARLDRGDDLLLGESVGQYRIARLLGVGGMGRVYKAVQPRINSRVAVKVLSHDCAGKPELVERFFAEARAVNLIRHENIINVLDLASLPDGRPYIIMEFLDGAPLSNVIADHPRMPLGSLARMVGEVLSALSAAHGTSIIHRDLKPDNIFITPQGRAKVLDFGIAKLMPELSGRSGPTRTGSLLGTPHYMAPEQANAQGVDARTDIYAMGVILYEGATGERPFKDAQSLYDLLRKVIEAEPTPAQTLRPDIPPSFAAVIDKAMRKSPAERYQSTDEMAHALAAAVRNLGEDAWVPVGPAGERRDARIGPPSIPTPSSNTPVSGAAHRSPAAPSVLGVASTVSSGQVAAQPRQATQSVTGKVWLIAGAAVLGVAALVVVVLMSTSGGSAKDKGNHAAHTDPTGVPNPPPTPHDPDKAAAALDRVDSVLKAPAQPPIGAATPESEAPVAVVPAPAIPPRAAPTPSASPGTYQPASFDAKHFDVSAFLPEAEAKARAHYPDAMLIRIDADGVGPGGTADLSLDKSFSVTYRFASPAGAKRPATLPMGVPHKPNCMFYVTVDQTGVQPRPLNGWKCKPPWLGRPKCSVKQIWDRAIVRGAPRTNAVAGIGFWARMNGNDGRWLFEIKDVKSFWVEDDC